MRRPLCLLWIATTSLAGACAPREAPSDRIRVAVSVPPEADLVRRLAGDRVQVEILVPPSADPDTYEPTMRQIRAISRAALIVQVGHPGLVFEKVWLDRVLDERPDVPVVNGTGAVPSGLDPHLWVSPRWMGLHAARTAEALSRLLPEERALIEERRARLAAEIDRLDREIRATLAPCQGDTFFVFHGAWERFAEEYGLVQVSIQEHGKEPSADHVAAVLDAARAAGAGVIFVQPQFSERSAQLMAEEVGARVHVLDPMVEDWMANLEQVSRTLRDALLP